MSNPDVYETVEWYERGMPHHSYNMKSLTLQNYGLGNIWWHVQLTYPRQSQNGYDHMVVRPLYNGRDEAEARKLFDTKKRRYARAIALSALGLS